MSWGDVTLFAFLAGSVVLVVAALASVLYLAFWCIDRLCEFLGISFWFALFFAAVFFVLIMVGGVGMLSPPLS